VSEPIIPQSWRGSDDGERWLVKVEHDLMDPAPGTPLVVTVEIENWEAGHDGQPDSTTYSLACLTPEQAREMADALHVYAFFAAKQNREREEQTDDQLEEGAR
jgi:hypothetical protein